MLPRMSQLWPKHHTGRAMQRATTSTMVTVEGIGLMGGPGEAIGLALQLAAGIALNLIAKVAIS